MKKKFPLCRIILVITGVFLFLPSCCPSGPWQDNFGAFYQLITGLVPPTADVFPIAGLVDTGDLGCGLWNVEGTSQVIGVENIVELLVINLHPNPEDPCCYSYRFNGHVDGSGCNFIPGQYQTNDGKCTQSGNMYLLSLQ